MTTPSISPMQSATSLSTQSSTSQTTSSTSSTHPQLARSGSHSHVFPSHQNLIIPQDPTPGTKTRGLSKETKALARRLLQNNANMSSRQDDHTILFSNGLQWLLDMTAETERNAASSSKRPSSRVSFPLTEDAVRGLDRHDRHSRIREARGAENMSRSEVDRARINAWVSETDAAP